MSEFVSNPINNEGDNKSFENIMNNVNGNFDYLNKKIDSDKTEILDKLTNHILFGTYTGNGVAKRFVDLGFTPTAVEVYEQNGTQGNKCDTYQSGYGGLALYGFDCQNSNSEKIIEIIENGFNVFMDNSGRMMEMTNSNGTVYYFKAYKDCSIMEVS